MAVALDCLGLASIGDGLIPADDHDAKGAAAERPGARRAARRDGSGPHVPDRRALLNAMAGVAATGGSTNGILHLLAIAREAGVPLTLDELAEIGAQTPVLASLAPSGRTPPRISTAPAARATLIRELCAAATSTAPPRPSRARSPSDAPAPSPTARCSSARRTRSGRPARCTRCAATSRPTAAWSRSPPTHGAANRGRRGSSTARRPASTRCGSGVAQAGDVLVLRYEGPAGGPDRELLSVTASVVGAGLGDRSRSSPTGVSSGRRAA